MWYNLSTVKRERGTTKMKTKAYYLPNNDQTAATIRLIALCVPCFITLNATSNNIHAVLEYTITARQEDWAWIEYQIAPIV